MQFGGSQVITNQGFALADNGSYAVITVQGGHVFGQTVIRNGRVEIKPFQVIDSGVAYAARGVSMNSQGELLTRTMVEGSFGNVMTALYFEGRTITLTGERVDLDGDGTLDPNTRISSFSDTYLTDGGTAFFDGYVQPVVAFSYPSLVREHVTGIGERYCDAEINSTGTISQLTAFGSTVVADDDFSLSSAGMPFNAIGIFLCSRTQGFMPLADGNLCLGGTFGRFSGAGPILSSGHPGRFELDLPLGEFPQGGSNVQVLAGETWNFQ